MNATIKHLDTTNYNPVHRKEQHFRAEYKAVVFDRDTGMSYDAVIARVYDTQSRTYCCLWVQDNCSWLKDAPFERTELVYRVASGYASGYGYHRASAAVGDAIEHAGIELSKDINGRGEGTIPEAIEAIARDLWPDRRYVKHITKANA